MSDRLASANAILSGRHQHTRSLLLENKQASRQSNARISCGQATQTEWPKDALRSKPDRLHQPDVIQGLP